MKCEGEKTFYQRSPVLARYALCGVDSAKSFFTRSEQLYGLTRNVASLHCGGVSGWDLFSSFRNDASFHCGDFKGVFNVSKKVLANNF